MTLPRVSMVHICSLAVVLVLVLLVIVDLGSSEGSKSSASYGISDYDSARDAEVIPGRVIGAEYASDSQATNTQNEVEVVSSYVPAVVDEELVIDIGEDIDADTVFDEVSGDEDVINIGEDIDVDNMDEYAAYEESVNIGAELDVDALVYEEPGETVNIGPDMAVEDRYSMDGYQGSSQEPINIGPDLDVPASY
ncbi:MAG: hypothetical protein ABJ084_03915 [Halioglobus sp.]